MTRKPSSLFAAELVRPACVDAFRKLDPRVMVKNPVMFVTLVGAVITTACVFTAAADTAFVLQLALWLWFTVLFANFAEAMAEGRGKAQADTLRKARTETVATRSSPSGLTETVPATSLRKDDVVMVKAGEFIPSDGEIIEGVASVDESAITGESAPVIRESGGDRTAVTGGTKVLFDPDGVGFASKAEPLGNARDVRIDDEPLVLAESVAENDVGRLAPNAGECNESFHGVGDATAALGGQRGARPSQAAGLGVEESGLADVVLELARRRPRVVRRGPVFPEEFGGDLVDPDVGALRGEDGRDEELERAREVERASGFRIRAGAAAEVGAGPGSVFLDCLA